MLQKISTYLLLKTKALGTTPPPRPIPRLIHLHAAVFWPASVSSSNLLDMLASPNLIFEVRGLFGPS